MLKDFEKWKSLNTSSSFSLYDYLFGVSKTSVLSSDIYFAFLELFWPSFVLHEHFVFLKENFSEEKFKGLIESENIQEMEYWMNLISIDSYFEGAEDWEQKAEFFSKKLAEIWQVKLTKDFPHLDFIVVPICDSESGDYGMTFYQKASKN